MSLLIFHAIGVLSAAVHANVGTVGLATLTL